VHRDSSGFPSRDAPEKREKKINNELHTVANYNLEIPTVLFSSNATFIRTPLN